MFGVFSLLFLWFVLMFGRPLVLVNYIIRYEVSNEAVLIKLFNLVTVRRIRLKDIENVSVIKTSPFPWGEGYQLNFTFYERWGSILDEKKVLIRKRRGLIRIILLTPPEPAEFVQQLSILLQETALPSVIAIDLS
jgi:hypothetical protein